MGYLIGWNWQDYDYRRDRALFEAEWDALEFEQADHARREHERYGGEDARLPLLPRRAT